MFKIRSRPMQSIKSSAKSLNRNKEIKCSLLTAATISGNWEMPGMWNSIKKLLRSEGWYLHSLLERSEQQEASFDVSGRCQITALLKTAHCDALTSADLLKWPVWLKVVNTKREFHSWVAFRILSKKTSHYKTIGHERKTHIDFSGTTESKIRETILQLYCSRWLDIWEQRYFCLLQMTMYFMTYWS